jgi:hypothetical protein
LHLWRLSWTKDFLQCGQIDFFFDDILFFDECLL